MNHQEHVVPLLGLSCASVLDACATKRPDPFSFNESIHNQLALPPEMRPGRTQRSRRTIAHTRTNKGHDPINKRQVKLGLNSVYLQGKKRMGRKKGAAAEVHVLVYPPSDQTLANQQPRQTTLPSPPSGCTTPCHAPLGGTDRNHVLSSTFTRARVLLEAV